MGICGFLKFCSFAMFVRSGSDGGFFFLAGKMMSGVKYSGSLAINKKRSALMQ